MCNANNHPSACNCGFGGEYHKRDREERAKFCRCFINSNAKCPVCGDLVFYYESENGGKVFFDDLWPYWPKHPCTDNKSSKLKRAITEQVIDTHKFLSEYSPIVVEEEVWNNLEKLSEIRAYLKNSFHTKLTNHFLNSYYLSPNHSFLYYRKKTSKTFEILSITIEGYKTIHEGFIIEPIKIGDELNVEYRGLRDKEKVFLNAIVDGDKKIYYSHLGKLNSENRAKVISEQYPFKLTVKVRKVTNEILVSEV